MLLVYTIALFAGSMLLFLVEPMFAKMALPLLGGSPSVWITSMLFFQATLLAGYAYAHASTARLGARRQAAVHMALLAVPFLTLPIALRRGWAPPANGSQVVWLLALLAVSVGLPFFVVSSAAPLLQRWFASTGHTRAADPYFLYRASNLGSMIGLLGYPVLLEPTLRLADQGRMWAWGYGILAAMTAACAVMLWRSPAPAPSGLLTASPDETALAPIAGASDGDLTLARRARWVALSFVPSSLLLGVTTHLTTDIAPIPLLWVIPLALYLLTFALVFSPRPPLPQRLMARALPLLVLPLVATILLKAAKPPWVPMLLSLLTFFVAAMVCHGRLAEDRPPVSRLTEFYLWIAVGGVLGGTCNALVAPVIFNSYAEYPLAIVLACLLRPGPVAAGRMRWSRVLDLALPVALAAVVAALAWWVRVGGPSNEQLRRGILVGVPAVLCFSFVDRPIRFGLGVGAILLAGTVSIGAATPVLFADRSFFGAYHVTEDPSSGGFHLLTHGTTVHGAQSLDPTRRDEPLTYYTRSGPLGQVFDAADVAGDDDIAVVGLGAGSMACYSRPGERWTFYEIDPLVERIARDPDLFTFLQDCLDDPRIVTGDARLSLERAAHGQYDLIAVDAFNSDAIPVHLITREAIALYLSKLADGGMLAFHISNQYVDLHPVLANLARDAGLVSFARDDGSVTEADGRAGKFPSDWVVMARDTADVGPIAEDPRWYRLGGDGSRVWTDDFSNILSVFSWT